jgi:hypothetical protein
LKNQKLYNLALEFEGFATFPGPFEHRHQFGTKNASFEAQAKQFINPSRIVLIL